MPDSNTDSKSLKPSFETSLESLRSIVRELESGSLTLDQSLKKYEEGVASLRSCYQSLQSAEHKINQLVSIDPSGRARTQSFNHQSSLEEPLDEEALQEELDAETENGSDMDEPDGLF